MPVIVFGIPFRSDNTMNKVISGIFGLSVAAMCWFAFVWPFVVSADRNDPLLRTLCISTLLIFFVSLVALLFIRVRSLRKENQEFD